MAQVYQLNQKWVAITQFHVESTFFKHTPEPYLSQIIDTYSVFGISYNHVTKYHYINNISNNPICIYLYIGIEKYASIWCNDLKLRFMQKFIMRIKDFFWSGTAFKSLTISHINVIIQTSLCESEQ